MVVAEALARGLPVVGTDTGAVRTLVGDSAGIVIPPGDVEALTDALRQVIGDSARLAHLADGARLLARRARGPGTMRSDSTSAALARVHADG